MESLNFIRHYKLSDGSYGGSNFGDFVNNTIVDHATDRDTGNVLARELGFSSVYHANAIIRRAGLEQTRLVELNAISVGGFSFVAAPYEMFANHGVYIKENTPFPMTFVISCCNGANGYLPSTDAYDYGCYESHTGNFTRETGDQLAEEFVSMLESLK